MTQVLPDFETRTQPIAARRYSPTIYDPAATAILRPDETLILDAAIGHPDTSGDIVPLMRLLQDPPTGNPPPLPPQPKPGRLRRRIFPQSITGPVTPPTNPPKPSPPPPPANWRPAHRRPAPLWAYAVASAGLTLAVFASGWVSCWAVAL